MGVNSFSWESIFSIYTYCQKNASIWGVFQNIIINTK